MSSNAACPLKHTVGWKVVTPLELGHELIHKKKKPLQLFHPYNFQSGTSVFPALDLPSERYRCLLFLCPIHILLNTVFTGFRSEHNAARVSRWLSVLVSA